MLDISALIGAVQVSQTLSKAVDELFWATVPKHVSLQQLATMGFTIPQGAKNAFEVALQGETFLSTLEPFDKGVLQGAIALLKAVGATQSLSLSDNARPTASHVVPGSSQQLQSVGVEPINKKRTYSAIVAEPESRASSRSSMASSLGTTQREAENRLARHKTLAHYDGCTSKVPCPLCMKVFMSLEVQPCNDHPPCSGVGWFPHWPDKERQLFLSQFKGTDPHLHPPRGLQSMSAGMFLCRTATVIPTAEEAARRRQEKQDKKQAKKGRPAGQKSVTAPRPAAAGKTPPVRATPPPKEPITVPEREATPEGAGTEVQYRPRSPSYRPTGMDWAEEVAASVDGVPPVYAGEVGTQTRVTRSQSKK